MARIFTLSYTNKQGRKVQEAMESLNLRDLKANFLRQEYNYDVTTDFYPFLNISKYGPLVTMTPVRSHRKPSWWYRGKHRGVQNEVQSA